MGEHQQNPQEALAVPPVVESPGKGTPDAARHAGQWLHRHLREYCTEGSSPVRAENSPAHELTPTATQLKLYASHRGCDIDYRDARRAVNEFKQDPSNVLLSWQTDTAVEPPEIASPPQWRRPESRAIPRVPSSWSPADARAGDALEEPSALPQDVARARLSFCSLAGCPVLPPPELLRERGHALSLDSCEPHRTLSVGSSARGSCTTGSTADTIEAFSLGDIVDVASGGEAAEVRQGVVVWDGRPVRPFLKVRWSEGGVVSQVIPVHDVRLVAPASQVVSIRLDLAREDSENKDGAYSSEIARSDVSMFETAGVPRKILASSVQASLAFMEEAASEVLSSESLHFDDGDEQEDDTPLCSRGHTPPLADSGSSTSDEGLNSKLDNCEKVEESYDDKLVPHSRCLDSERQTRQEQVLAAGRPQEAVDPMAPEAAPHRGQRQFERTELQPATAALAATTTTLSAARGRQVERRTPSAEYFRMNRELSPATSECSMYTGAGWAPTSAPRGGEAIEHYGIASRAASPSCSACSCVLPPDAAHPGRRPVASPTSKRLSPSPPRSPLLASQKSPQPRSSPRPAASSHELGRLTSHLAPLRADSAPEQRLTLAKRFLRGVTWEFLCENLGSTGAFKLDDRGGLLAESQLYARAATPLQAGHVDGFVSHAWSADADLRALQLFDSLNECFAQLVGTSRVTAAAFKATLWLDKFSLPWGGEAYEEVRRFGCFATEFLAVSRRLFALCSPEYFLRQWCRFEFATFLALHPQECVFVGLEYWLNSGFTSFEVYVRTLRDVTTTQASCSCARDREIIRTIIDENYVSVERFDKLLSFSAIALLCRTLLCGKPPESNAAPAAPFMRLVDLANELHFGVLAAKLDSVLRSLRCADISAASSSHSLIAGRLFAERVAPLLLQVQVEAVRPRSVLDVLRRSAGRA